MSKTKYITWKEPVYLLTLPILRRVEVCYECGSRAWRWDKKSFIKIREIEHKRKRTLTDDVMETTSKFFDKYMADSLTRHITMVNYMLGKK